MGGRKLRSGAYWQGAVKQKGLQQTGVKQAVHLYFSAIRKSES
jgi:hypothetical protein